jgi:hypothetical protein
VRIVVSPDDEKEATAMSTRQIGSRATVIDDPAGLPGMTTRQADPAVMSAADKTAAITKVQYLEHELFDSFGQVRRRTDRDAAEVTVAAVNDLRRALGWLEIDLDGHWRWPEDHARSTSGTF